MKKYFLHGMGGSSKDWSEVLSQCDGEALEINDSSSLEAATSNLTKKISSSDYLLCGYSMGARLSILCTESLMRQGNPPKTLVLVSSGMGFLDENEQKLRKNSDRKWAQLARANPSEFWEKWYKQDLFSSFSSLSPPIQQSWREDRLSIDINVLCHQIENLSPANHPYLAPKIRNFVDSGISVLYIVGELDKKYLSEAKKMEDFGATVKVIQGAGHIIPLETPTALAKIISSL